MDIIKSTLNNSELIIGDQHTRPAGDIYSILKVSVVNENLIVYDCLEQKDKTLILAINEYRKRNRLHEECTVKLASHPEWRFCPNCGLENMFYRGDNNND